MEKLTMERQRFNEFNKWFVYVYAYYNNVIQILRMCICI